MTIVMLLVGGMFIKVAFQQPIAQRLNIVEVNDIVKTVENNWGNQDQLCDLVFPYHIDFVVLDNEGHLVKATKRGLNETIYAAIANRDTVIDIQKGTTKIGTIIFYNDTNEMFKTRQQEMQRNAFILLLVCVIYGVILVVYLQKTVLQPFKLLKAFAKNIAVGNLDTPLPMDKNNAFGAFSESFDLMREQLKAARENERNATESKKTLVALLSHDIKTPVASIKALSQLMVVCTDNEKQIKQLSTINAKADQINSLITNMFHATLEELTQLHVTTTEQPSIVLATCFENADIDNKIKILHIEECIVVIDTIRIQQVIDNVIFNAYKYAGTDIEVSTYFDENNLVVEITDFGNGVKDEDIPLVFNKFYRGENAINQEGTGLGLYISKYFMEKMQGRIDCKNTPKGFLVKLTIRLA